MAAPRDPQLVLASASPRRAALLTQLGFAFVVKPADVDETRLDGESVDAMVRRLALAKANVAARGETLPVLGADTAVTLDGALLGKPADRTEGIRMLTTLSGRTHAVLTAVAVVHRVRAEVRVSRSRVTFRAIDAAEAQRYWDSGEPRDKAGGYGIQGIGGIFAERIEGSYSGIVGLPLAETDALLQAFGVDTWRYRGA
ncbi:MAG TPA: nucleoside triphosphate pyrophosphatase [Pseudomonadales bacterium]|nr:nucleoside triphosphate pyrophosphatase [Pseudomonadales bacterium]